MEYFVFFSLRTVKLNVSVSDQFVYSILLFYDGKDHNRARGFS